jgi:ribosomal protein S6
MPCYRFLCLARPDTAPAKLAEIFRGVAKVVYREKGQFRTIENLGIRPLHWPIRAFGNKFDDARWVQFYCDVSPAGLTQVRGLIRQEEAILMATPLRARAELGEVLGDFRPHRRLVEKKKFKLPTATSPIGELLQ